LPFPIADGYRRLFHRLTGAGQFYDGVLIPGTPWMASLLRSVGFAFSPRDLTCEEARTDLDSSPSTDPRWISGWIGSADRPHHRNCLNVQLNPICTITSLTDFSGNEGQASSTLNTVAVPVPGEVPLRFALWPNRPNPFASSTFITFDLPSPEQVVIRIFDLSGAQVKTLVDATLEARRYSIAWTGEDDHGLQVKPGVYFYRLDSARFQKQKSIQLHMERPGQWAASHWSCPFFLV
jgi:hypothetical protein